jgi:replicative DNA helicase
MRDEIPHPGDRRLRRERSLPHHLGAEASILGGIILRPEVLEQLPDLEVDDFFDLRHKTVFQAMRYLEAQASPIDLSTLEAEIEKQGKLEALGGVAFLGEVAMKVPTADNVVHYAKLVRGAAIARNVAIAADDIVAKARTWTEDPIELVAEARHTFEQIAKRHTDAERPLRVINAFQALDELKVLADAPIYQTPFPTLNAALGFGGMLGTQVYTVAAGTGRGKTSFVGAIAGDQAQRTDVIVASYEMKPGYFVARHTAGKLGVHSNAIIRGQVSLKEIAAAMPHARLFFMHKQPLGDVRRAVLRSKSKRGVPPLLIVDYLQKLTEEIMRTQQRPDARLATAEASAMLCEIAEETGCAILAVSATSRASSRRTLNPRKLEPYELVDVSKESGSVEYDGAGLIVLSLSSEFDGEERIATMTLAKARFGEEQHIDARYHGARGDWRDLGRVQDDDESDTSAEESADDLRARIVRAVSNEAAKSKREIGKRLRMSGSGVRNERLNPLIEEMLQAGEIAYSRDGFVAGKAPF